MLGQSLDYNMHIQCCVPLSIIIIFCDSLEGVRQLEQDYSFFMEAVHSTVSEELNKAAICNTEILRQFYAIITILWDQPSEMVTTTPKNQINMTRSNRVSPLHQPAVGDGDVLSAEDKLHWLNLRAKVPGRLTLFPCSGAKSCLQTT